MDLAAIITAVAALLSAAASTAAVLATWGQGRTLTKVAVQTDGMSKALIEKTHDAALAEGKKQQTDDAAKAEGVAAIQTLKDQKPGI